MSEKKVEGIEIPEPETPVEKESIAVTEEAMREQGMSDAEIELARKNGMIAEKEQSKKNPESEQVKEPEDEEEDSEEEGQDSEDEKDKQTFDVEDFDTFEKIHDLYQNDVKAFYNLPRHVKNLYHNSKGIYKRYKEEEEARKEIEGKVELDKVKASTAEKKIQRIKERLSNPENLTIEDLQEILGQDAALSEESDKPLTRKDLEELENKKNQEESAKFNQQKELQRRILRSEEYAKSNIKDLTDGKYEDIGEVVDLAQEVARSKTRYMDMINEAFLDENFSEDQVVDVILDIARLNPKWGKKEPAGKNGETDVDRMVRNSKKKKTSAAISGGKGSRVVSFDDLTPEDASNLNEKQWMSLPREVRKRILSEL